MRPILLLLLLGMILASLQNAAYNLVAILRIRTLQRSEDWQSTPSSSTPVIEFNASRSETAPLAPTQIESLKLVATSLKKTSTNSSIEFASDIQPLLARNCWACHGPNEQSREAELRLDTQEGLTGTAASGLPVVVPGNPDSSELIQRIVSSAPDKKMPPVDSHKPLAEHEIELLEQWIREGATIQPHWAFQSLQPVSIPEDSLGAHADRRWYQNPIDLFVLKKLMDNGLVANPPADRVKLLRRVSLDLTGLPPDYERVQQILSTWSETSYEDYVDSLLASPAYGERMAAPWLSAARYADTNGYQHDNGREMWPWRDWVIRALNQNMPFDQFVTEQLAGDLLPNPQTEQLVATGFNRNHGINFEGGSLDAESQCDYVVDRTNTFGTVFLGLTLGCAQCHDHKTDPISQAEYFGLFAFFNTIDEKGFAGEKGNAEPLIELDYPERDKRLNELQRLLEQLQEHLDETLDAFDSGQSAWEQSVREGATAIDRIPQRAIVHLALNDSLDDRSRITQHLRVDRNGTLASVPEYSAWEHGLLGQTVRFDGTLTCDLGNIADFEADQAFSFGAWVNANAIQAAPILGRAMFHGFDLVWENNAIRVDLVHRWDNNAIFARSKPQLKPQQWYHVMATYDGTSQAAGVHIFIDGQAIELTIDKDCLTGSIKSNGNLFVAGRNEQPGTRFQGLIQDVRIYDRELTEVEVAQLAERALIDDYLTKETSDRNGAAKRLIREYYLLHNDPGYLELRVRISEIRRELAVERNRRLTTMVMREMTAPRVTRRLNRGRYDSPAESVSPGVPGIFPTMLETQKANRLSLAQWLVSPKHPLTARVAVNRQWQIFFGRGLVETSDDFGAQGSPPSHPELLDWLANVFVSSGWDLKRLHRQIVTSATYQQSSTASSQATKSDPENRWLSHYPIRRLPAEFVRDQLLVASGLCDLTMGGPGVMPPQPVGLWDELSFKSGYSAQEYTASHGGDLFRRSIYTYWKRTCPPPNMAILDAPERTSCCVLSQTSNTPLQALVILNDPCFVEPATFMALQVASRFSDDNGGAIVELFRRLLSRAPRAQELSILNQLYEAAATGWSRETAHDFLSKNSSNVWGPTIDKQNQSPLIQPPHGESPHGGHHGGKARHGEQSLPVRACSLATVAQVILAMDESLTIN